MLLPEIIGYDVVCTTTGRIHVFTAPDRETAQQAAEGIPGSVVVPVLKTLAPRVGYRVQGS